MSRFVSMDGHWLTVRHKMIFGKTVIPAAVDERGMWTRPAESAGAAAAGAAGAADKPPKPAAATASPAAPHTPALTAAQANRSGAPGIELSAGMDTPVLQQPAAANPANPGMRSSRRSAASKGLMEEAMQAELNAAPRTGAAGMQTRKRARQVGSAGHDQGKANGVAGRHSVKRKR